MSYKEHGKNTENRNGGPSMRLVNVDSFSARKSEVREPNRTYIIFTEGVETEQDYFVGLGKLTRLKSNIQMKVINRWRSVSGKSNPKKIVEDINKYIDNITCITNEDLKKIREYCTLILEGCNIGDLIGIANRIQSMVDRYPRVLSKEEKIQQQLLSIVAMSTYEKEFDVICVIVDRDKESFTEEQYAYVLENCSQEGFRLGLSNPCFEFFSNATLR